MRKIRVVIADDNADAIEIMKYFIEQLPNYEIVGVCFDGEQLVETVMADNPDLVLADINMPKLNGIESIKSILNFRTYLNVIFITSYDEYAVDAFDISAIDYLVKPIEKTRLYRALEKFNKSLPEPLQERNQRIRIQFGGSIFYIPVHEILFIEKVGRKCLVYTENRYFETYENIAGLYSELDGSRFFMTHRSYIINLSKVVQITTKKDTIIASFYNSKHCAHIAKRKLPLVKKLIESI